MASVLSKRPSWFEAWLMVDYFAKIGSGCSRSCMSVAGWYARTVQCTGLSQEALENESS